MLLELYSKSEVKEMNNLTEKYSEKSTKELMEVNGGAVTVGAVVGIITFFAGVGTGYFLGK